MGMQEDRLSTEVIDNIYIDPEGDLRNSFLHDFEGGPRGITDTSEGMNSQIWVLSYSNNDIVLTPQTIGAPYTVLTIPDCQQLSFCFDQNARPSVFYVTGTSAYHYWYDSVPAKFVTTEHPNTVSGMLSLDDKRDLQLGANDILLWYTEEVSPGVHYLYHRKQRDRFDTPYEMRMDPNTPMPVPPYLWKAGMHQGLRGKVTLTYRTPGS